MRVFYAAGPGNVIQAHKYWAKGEHDPNEVSVTFSSQFEDFCRDVGAQAYIVSYHNETGVYREGDFILEHRPKPTRNKSGLAYHLAEIRYGLGLLATALKFGANVAVVDSGSTHYFVQILFALVGIKTICVLHHSICPSGFPPTSP